MKPEIRNRLAALSIIVASLSSGLAVWLITHHTASALLCALIAVPVLVSFYSGLAWALGWPPPNWSDVWAIGYLLP